MNWRLHAGGVAIGVVVGLTLGFGTATVHGNSQVAALFAGIRPIRLQNDKYPLINPLIAYQVPETIVLSEYKTLKENLQAIIDSHRESIGRISVYYRNLNTSDVIGINQNDTYYPASLLKVPLMVAFFKEAESDPSFLQKRIVYQTITGGDPFETRSALVPGTSYSVEELIEKMIIDSDNGATFTLLDNIDSSTLDEVYTDLGIMQPGEDTSSYQISTRVYALFFRILYNATYLTPEYSQRALELLSNATYADGLAAGVPAGISVAHKYGEYIVSTDRKTPEGVELHDCGIVYHPKQQYLLCVMTEANTQEAGASIIQAISKEVYDAMSAN